MHVMFIGIYILIVRIRFRNVLLKKGEFGCLYSHLKAINLFLKSNEKYCFICEDDLDPNILNYYDKKVFTKKIKKIISKIDKYGIISLSCVGPYKLFQKIFSKDNSFLNNKFVSFEKYLFYGTGCYLINKETAKKIINNFIIEKDNKIYIKLNGLKTSMVADNFLYIHSDTKFYLPSLFFTKNFDSLIQTSSNTMELTQKLMKTKLNRQ